MTGYKHPLLFFLFMFSISCEKQIKHDENSSINILAKIGEKITIGKSENTNEPKLPDMVFLGLIFVNFFPPIKFPTIYPPVSENTQINIMKSKLISDLL